MIFWAILQMVADDLWRGQATKFGGNGWDYPIISLPFK